MTTSYPDATRALPRLLHKVLTEGHITDSRNGRTKELMMANFTLADPAQPQITTPGRRVAFPAQIAEMMWMLAGRDDIEWLSNYLPRAKDFSDDGKTWRGAYGPRIRNWINEHGYTVDQLAHVVDLLKRDPATRRAVVTIYNPAIDTKPGKDIPCNNWIHFLGRDGKLNGHVVIRSNDLMWGWSGINSFEWAVLLRIVAGLTGFELGTLTFSISSLHLYERHWAKAEKIVKGLEGTVPHEFRQVDPQFAANVAEDVAGLDKLVEQWFKIEDQIRNTRGESGQVRYMIDRFPEPMLRSWLRVIYAWWHGDVPRLLAEYKETALYYAALYSPKRNPDIIDKLPEWDDAPSTQPTVEPGGFAEYVSNLHAEKHAAYGDSWMKRGELLGCISNIARKADRLGVAGAGDTAADTAIDMLAYTIKYRLWLSEHAMAPRGDWLPQTGQLTSGPDHATYVTGVLARLGDRDQLQECEDDTLIHDSLALFETLEQDAVDKVHERYETVDQMIPALHSLAVRLWKREEWAKGNKTRRWNPEEV